jgi:hypothetical protein
VAAGERISGRKPIPEKNGDLKDRLYKEIVQHDIFLNAIYLPNPIPPFVNNDLLAKPGRKLSIVVISYDITNPIPINTTFTNPWTYYP